MATPKRMIPAYPYPWGVRLGTRPQRSWLDMALILGTEWVLPEDLQKYYPEPPPDQDFQDENGLPIGVTFSSLPIQRRTRHSVAIPSCTSYLCKSRFFS